MVPGMVHLSCLEDQIRPGMFLYDILADLIWIKVLRQHINKQKHWPGEKSFLSSLLIPILALTSLKGSDT